MSLLEKALAAKPKRRQQSVDGSALDEQIDLAIALLEGRITNGQAAQALECGPTAAAGKLRNIICTAARRGLVRIERVK